MLNISDAEKSEQENRMLAKYFPFIVQGGVNYNYGAQFNEWFNDRFFGRGILINLYNDLNFRLSAHVKSNGWCINKETKWIGRCSDMRKMPSDSEMQHIVRNIERLKKFAQKHNMKFYILIPPTQGLLYGKKISPFWVSNELKNTQKIKNYIKQYTDIDVLYPYEEILNKSKEELVFFKTDIHWNDVGAFVAYSKLMDIVKKDFNDVSVLDLNDFNYFYSNKIKVDRTAGFSNGGLYKATGLNDASFLQEKYKYLIHKSYNQLIVNLKVDSKEDYTRGFYEFNGGKYNVTLFGNSFGENLMSIIPYSFNKTLRLYTGGPEEKLTRNLNLERFEKQIVDNKTDILIINLSSIQYLKYLYRE